MKSMKKITVLLFNDFVNDNRVLKECRSLQENGYEVQLYATHFDKKLPLEDYIEVFEKENWLKLVETQQMKNKTIYIFEVIDGNIEK